MILGSYWVICVYINMKYCIYLLKLNVFYFFFVALRCDVRVFSILILEKEKKNDLIKER